MKPNLFLGRSLSTAAVLALGALALPNFSQGVPPPFDAKRTPARAPAAAPRPAAPAARPQVAPPPVARPSVAPSRPSVAPSRPSVTVARPSASQRPTVSRVPEARRPSPSISRPPEVRRPTTVSPIVVAKPSDGQRSAVVVRPGDSGRRPSASDYQRPPSVVTRPGVPARPSYVPGGVLPDRMTGQERAATARAYPGYDSTHRRYDGPRRDFRFNDSSRFSHIDRSIAYRSYPHRHYRMNYANGYRGMGWYYGPPSYSYYSQSPNILYYAARSLIPSTYASLIYSRDNSIDYSVQEALANLGYYYGPVDGDIGPMSRLAIANFQADNGLEPTGIIDETLLDYLQIQ